MQITNRKKVLSIGGGGAMLLFLILLYTLFMPNMRETSTVVLQHDCTFEQMIAEVASQSSLRSVATFKITSKLLFYKNVRQGKYVFDKNSSNFSMIYKLRKGQHFPVQFTFTTARTKDQLIAKLSKKDFFFAWSDLRKLLDDKEFLKKYGLTPETAICVFLPNTYEFYYDITAETFFEKMFGYYEKFWTAERKALAESIGLTHTEVMTLASIVEEENYRDFEKARIAGLYMNRLHQDMRLQADPTVKFAVGDFSLKRILNVHLKVDSPYNTYLYKGLPPGPIRIPAASTVDAVLHYEHHNYLYMCAKEDFSGAHNFTDNYNEHLKNARKYQAALDARTKQ